MKAGAGRSTMANSLIVANRSLLDDMASTSWLSLALLVQDIPLKLLLEGAVAAAVTLSLLRRLGTPPLRFVQLAKHTS